MDTQETKEIRLDRFGPAGLLVGVLGIIICLAKMFSGSGVDMLQSYLFAYIFWAALTLGCFGLTLLHHTLRGKWGLPILRMFEAGGGARMLTLMAVLIIPILFVVLKGDGTLYMWTDPATVAHNDLLKAKEPYLNPMAFTIRTIIYFVLWIGLAAFLRKSSLLQDKNKDKKEEQKRTNWSAPGIVAFFVTITLAFTDWVMSLEPTWFSTMFGVWFAVGQALAALALVTFILVINANKKPYSQIINPELTRDLGNLLFAITMLWAYTSISQYLIIWSGNLPEFTQYFVRRSENHWNAIGMVLIIGQFFVPFFALLAPRMKRIPMNLARVCGWILVMRLVDIYITVIPAFPDRVGSMPLWTDIVALISIGGLWVAAFASQIKRAPLLPEYDKRLLEDAPHHA